MWQKSGTRLRGREVYYYTIYDDSKERFSNFDFFEAQEYIDVFFEDFKAKYGTAYEAQVTVFFTSIDRYGLADVHSTKFTDLRNIGKQMVIPFENYDYVEDVIINSIVVYFVKAKP